MVEPTETRSFPLADEEKRVRPMRKNSPHFLGEPPMSDSMTNLLPFPFDRVRAGGDMPTKNSPKKNSHSVRRARGWDSMRNQLLVEVSEASRSGTADSSHSARLASSPIEMHEAASRSGTADCSLAAELAECLMPLHEAESSPEPWCLSWKNWNQNTHTHRCTTLTS